MPVKIDRFSFVYRARKRAQMTVAPAKPTQKFLDMQKAAHQKIADERDKALKKLEKIEESQNKSKKAGQLKSRVAEGTANASNTSDKAIDQYGILMYFFFSKTQKYVQQRF